MLALASIFSCLFLLVTTEPYNGYELGNYIGLLVYHDTPHYGYVKFPSDDGSRLIRKSHYREYERPPPSSTYYPDSYTSYHHSPPFHPPPPHHGPPPFPPHHHKRPPSNTYGPPPPFGKPPSYHHGPPHSRHPFHHHSPPPAFSSSENYNYGSWESQDYEDVHSGEKDCKGHSRHPHPGHPPKQPIFSTSFTAPPNKKPSTTTSQSGGVFPNFRPTPIQTVTSTASGTTIAATNGLISGNVNQGNCHQQSTLISPSLPSQQSNILVTSSRPTLSSQGTDVSSLVNGVFQNAGQQFGQQTNPNIPTTSGTGVDSLVAGVFPGLAAQGSQAQQTNTPTTSTTSVDSLLGGVFPNSNTQSNIPQQQNIPNVPTMDIDGLVTGVFSPTAASNNQPQQNIPGISGSNVDNVIAGVFPSLSQGQQNTNPTVVTAPSTANGLISGIFQGLPQQGGSNPPSTIPTFPQSTQNNDDSIPVFQPDIPTNQQTNSFDSTSSNINSSQNIPTFQPPVDSTSGATQATPTAPGVDDSTGSDDDSPAFDIDIRLGQIGDEVTPNSNQRSGTATT